MQTYNPDQVVQIDLIDMKGELTPFYFQRPQVGEQSCPYTHSIKVKQTDLLVQGIQITIVQSGLGLGWNEIDAVQLVGVMGQSR